MADVIDGGGQGAPMAAPKASHVAGVVAGNALEFYDFLTYAFFAAQIGRSFYPSHDATSSLLASLATFGAGFLMRPVGAFFIGRLGDRAGRKPAMLVTFTLMGSAMIGMALIPPQAVIGWAAPALAILCRLAQGFALGGEVGPSTAYLMEAAPAHRRGAYVSLQFVGQDLAVTLAGVIGFTLANLLSDAALDSWGWRVAFLAGGVIVPFGLWMRRDLVETLDKQEPRAAPPAPVPGGKIAPPLAWLVTLSIVILAGNTTATYTLNYLTTYSTVTLHMAKTLGFAATIAVGVMGMVGDFTGGAVSDRLGRKLVITVPWMVLLLVTLPAFFLLAQARTGVALLATAGGLAFIAHTANATMLVAVTEGLPKPIRSGSLGLIYAFAISVFGGSTQFTVAWLTKVLHTPLAPALYMTGVGLVALCAILLLPESAPVKRRRG